MNDTDTQDPDVKDQDTQDPNQTKPWIESFSPEYRENPAITKYKSADDLAKGFLEAQKMIGKEKIPVPGADANPEDWAMVYDRLGRPAKPEEYKIPQFELPEGLTLQEESIKSFQAKAHELGLNQKQLEGLLGYYTETQKTAFNQMIEGNTKTTQETEKALRAEWGTAFQEKVGFAEKVLKLAAGEDYEYFRQKYGNDPKAIKLFANLGGKMAEDSLGGDAPQGHGKTPEEAMAEIKQIQGEMINSPKHPLSDPFHPEHKLFKDKMDSLYRQAYPNAS